MVTNTQILAFGLNRLLTAAFAYNTIDTDTSDRFTLVDDHHEIHDLQNVD